MKAPKQSAGRAIAYVRSDDGAEMIEIAPHQCVNWRAVHPSLLKTESTSKDTPAESDMARVAS